MASLRKKHNAGLLAHAGGPQPRKNMNRQIANDRGINRKHSFYFTAPGALSVQLAGDFTSWEKQPVNLQKGADGIWRTSLELAPGEHHYRFLVDGEWRDDPECPIHVPNPYGSQDAVRKVA
jgi:1,4-alpha-glucan branching enzyme